MKGPSEATFGKALRMIDLRMYVYKPPDPKGAFGVSNWKPCDFMVWVGVSMSSVADSAWFEVKDIDAVDRFPYSELRPAQLEGIHEARRVGIPYWLAVYWRRHRSWTISDAHRLLAERRKEDTSVDRTLLMSRYGVQSHGAELPSVVKAVLLGEV